jgi:hypothetical protein
VWPELDAAGISQFLDRLAEALRQGAFHYVVVAQRFTQAMEATARYLNELAKPARFYLVELVRFSGGGLDAFEGRTILRPAPSQSASPASIASETAFLGEIEDESYRDACGQLFDLARALDLQFEWGAKGTSIRLRVPNKAQPVSVVWAFPPNVAGWLGLSNLTFGFDSAQVANIPASTIAAFDRYAAELAAIPGAQPTGKKSLSAVTLSPAAYVQQQQKLAELLASFVGEMSGDSGATPAS